ncbi:MAG: hypothetical protein ACK5FZ_06915 [Bacteroidota bacterium]|jgi:hypothetical protein
MEATLDIQERNLHSLTSEFHNRGKAARGLKTIRSHIKRGKMKALANLLDHHDNVEGGYWGEELIQRFEIDALLEFYSLLVVARAAGYIPAVFGRRLNEEIKTVLTYESVIPYYTKHYPYKMLTYALLYAQGKRINTTQTSIGDTAIFNGFAALSRALKKDEDMERFMGMLDHVWYDGYEISDVIKILSNANALSQALTTKNKTEAEIAVMGFVKYSAFLGQLRLLMEAARHNPMLQSAMWLFHGYYLDRLHKKMSRVFAGALKNLEKGMAKPGVIKQMTDEIANHHENKQRKKKTSSKTKLLEEKVLKAAIKDSLKQTRADVAYVLNPKWGTPLKKFFEHA